MGFGGLIGMLMRGKTDDKNRKQPILIITDNNKNQQEILQFLSSKVIQNLASITGKETDEERLKIIDDAMKNDKIIVATGLVGRGTDWKPQSKDGLMVVNLAQDITYREYIQILGRAGRRGANGDTYTLIENATLTKKVASNEQNAFEAIKELYEKNFS